MFVYDSDKYEVLKRLVFLSGGSTEGLILLSAFPGLPGVPKSLPRLPGIPGVPFSGVFINWAAEEVRKRVQKNGETKQKKTNSNEDLGSILRILTQGKEENTNNDQKTNLQEYFKNILIAIVGLLGLKTSGPILQEALKNIVGKKKKKTFKSRFQDMLKELGKHKLLIGIIILALALYNYKLLLALVMGTNMNGTTTTDIMHTAVKTVGEAVKDIIGNLYAGTQKAAERDRESLDKRDYELKESREKEAIINEKYHATNIKYVKVAKDLETCNDSYAELSMGHISLTQDFNQLAGNFDDVRNQFLEAANSPGVTRVLALSGETNNEQLTKMADSLKDSYPARRIPAPPKKFGVDDTINYLADNSIYNTLFGSKK
jgi:hypothetical protein